MRTLGLLVVILVLVAISTRARADSFAELAGGLAIPASDDNWTKLVGASPKLAARGGSMSGELGGMLGVDWTPESLDNGGGSSGLGSTAGSLQRFRVLASGVIRHRITPTLTVGGRAGAGIDIAHASYDVTLLGTTTSGSDTDVGYAFEFGVGLWVDVGTKQVGVELAVPFGHHDKPAQQSGDLPFQWTSIDVDLLVGVRF